MFRKYNAYPGIALLLAAGRWLYVLQVMISFERERYAAIRQPVNPGDLYPVWYGARELLLHGRDPYSRAVAGEIQTAYFGHSLDLTNPMDRRQDDQRFYYPLYVVFFLAPTVAMPFAMVRLLIRCVLVVCMVTSVLLWLRALRWRPSMPLLLTILLLTLSCPALVQGLKVQQLGLLVAFFLAACGALVTSGSLFWEGSLLAFATLKPQMALLPVLWLMIWATGDWRGRQRLVWGFAGTLALLMGAAQWLSPGWLVRFLTSLAAYLHSSPVRSVLDLYLSQAIATPIGVGILVALGVACFRRRHELARSDSFFVQLSTVLAIQVLVIPLLLPPFNQVLLLPGLLVVIRYWHELWNASLGVRGVCMLALAVVFWPWLVAPALALTHIEAPQIPLRLI